MCFFTPILDCEQNMIELVTTPGLIQNGNRARMQWELDLRPRRPPLPTPSYRLPPPDVSSGQDLLRRDGGWTGPEAVVEAYQVLPLTFFIHLFFW